MRAVHSLRICSVGPLLCRVGQAGYVVFYATSSGIEDHNRDAVWYNVLVYEYFGTELIYANHPRLSNVQRR